MSLDFKEDNLIDLCELVTDGSHHSPPSQVEGYYMASVKDMGAHKFIYSDCRKISEEDYDKLVKSRCSPKNEDILIAKDGSPLSNIFIYQEEYPMVLLSSIAIIRANKNKILPEFLKYYLENPSIKKYIQTTYTSGSVIPRIILKDFKKFPINYPDIANQKKIIGVLKSIDEKIAINEEINKNLEEQLLEIFNSWFFKFELSTEFIDSSLGVIPKGWNVDYLGSKKSCSIIGSGIDDFNHSKIYIATADVDNSIITNNETLITFEDKPSRANMQPVEKSIWFAKMIDSRKLIMVDNYCYELLNNYIFSTGFCGLKCKDEYFYYLWTFLLSDTFDTIKNNFCTGTTMQAINNKDTKLIDFVLPDNELLSKFNNIAEPIYQKIYYNNLEINKLQKLRDILLPKLMSGEIDVSKINY